MPKTENISGRSTAFKFSGCRVLLFYNLLAGVTPYSPQLHVQQVSYSAAVAAGMVVLSGAMPVKRAVSSSSDEDTAAAAGSPHQSIGGETGGSTSDVEPADQQLNNQCFLKFPVWNRAPGRCQGNPKRLGRLREMAAQKIGGSPDLGKFADGAVDEIDLIASRADGIFDLTTQNEKYMCQKHRRDYGTHYWPKFKKNVPKKLQSGVQRYQCGMPTVQGFAPAHQQRKLLFRDHFITKEESKVLLLKRQILVPIGTRKCIQ